MWLLPGPGCSSPWHRAYFLSPYSYAGCLLLCRSFPHISSLITVHVLRLLSHSFLAFVHVLLSGLPLFLPPPPPPRFAEALDAPYQAHSLLPRMSESRASAPWMFQSGRPCCRPVGSSPDVPVRAPCACPLASASPRVFQSRGPRCSAASSWPRMFESVAPCLPSFYSLPCRLSVVPFCAAPSSPSLLSSRFMFLVSSLIHSMLLFMFLLPFLAATASSSLCSPGRSNAGPLASSPDVTVQGFCPPDVSVQVALLPAGTFLLRMFQSGLRALVCFPLRPPECSSPKGPVAVQLLPGLGCSSPWPWVHPPRRSSPGAVHQSAPDAPIRGVILSYYPFRHWPVLVVCVPPWFFFRVPFVARFPPLLPALLCVPSCSPPTPSLPIPLPSPPPFPFLPRAPLLPSPGSLSFPSLCGGFAEARTEAPSFYARMLLCFRAGTDVPSRSFFPAFSLFSCFALSFITCHCVQSCPLVPSSFPSSLALCVALGRSLCPLLYACTFPPSPFARTQAFFVCLGHALKLLFLRVHFTTLSFSFLVPLFRPVTYSLVFARCLTALATSSRHNFLFNVTSSSYYCCLYALMCHAIYLFTL